MKRPIILLVAAFCLLQISAKAEKRIFKKSSKPLSIANFYANSSDQMTKGGFYFHAGGFFPSKNYMWPVAFGTNDTGEKFKTGFDFELGNMFRIAGKDPIGFGLRATWFSAGLTKIMFSDTFGIRALKGSIIRLGPYFTYKIGDMAVDVFYQAGATYALTLDHKWNSDGSSGAIGVTHELGTGLRFNVLSFGAGYHFGKIKDTEAFGEPAIDDLDWYMIRTGSMRLFVGIKI